MKLTGWGRHPVVEAEERLGEDLAPLTDGAVLSRGLGRSYGDASLPADGVAVGTVNADRILDFDSSTGVLRAEAGLTLHELSRLFWPRGFSSPVLPGTAYITLGGMVAADVHAKNHHRPEGGTIGRYIRRLKMRLADGRVLWTSRAEEPDLFRATVGGMGLTGHVLEVELTLQRIPSAWVYQETERFADLDRYIEGFEKALEWPFTMGWIDCLKRGRSMGRGILYRGRWASVEEAGNRPAPKPLRRKSLPIDLPSGLLNRQTLSVFNFGIYRIHVPKVKRSIVHPETFFHPLDKLLSWNRGYGRRGFTQHQSVIPTREGAKRFLRLLTDLGVASFLCVIKDCGEEGEGILSFPKSGTSIAVDIPVRDRTRADIARLNEQVIAEGGRIYLAKDTFTSAEDYAAMDPRVEEFLRIRRRYDPDCKLRSLQSVRLFGD
ncbi:MAG: FAD-binding oxidoreductase [Thermoanaerobaculia bacterium]|nr:FAD-binding oxidoreductase [Thermoanaerobaculia bacterium]